MADLAQDTVPEAWADPQSRPYLVRPAIDQGATVQTSHTVQAAAEGVVMEDDGKLEFLGERFGLAERIGLMPMLAFANASKAGLDSDDMEGLAAMFALVRDVIDQSRPVKEGSDGQPLMEPDGVTPQYSGPSEWQRFEQHCYAMQADGEDIMDFVSRAMAVVAARPRKPRSISSDSSRPTSPTSKPASSSQGTLPPGFEGMTPVSRLGS